MALRLFYASLVSLLIFIGCGGGGGGGGGTGLSPVGPALINGRISGTLEVDSTIASVRPEASVMASRRFLDSFVTIEEMPNLSTRTDEEGRFVFDNLPMGSYRILARITSLTGRQYKIRTSPLTVTQTEPGKDAPIKFAQADVAESQIRLQVKDLNGNPVGNCKIWFWGEQFTLDKSGYYVSPKMPAGAAGPLKIEPPAGKDLSKTEFILPGNTFSETSVAVLGFTLPTVGITNKAPIVGISTSRYPNSGEAFLRLIGQASDPEGESLVTSWQTTVSTFTYKTHNYADWAIPSTAASVTVYFSASENGRFYPRLTSTAQLAINVASSGIISFPGEIVIKPVNRTVDIWGSATQQIPGNTIARFEARPDFPAGLTLKYKWTADRGSILSGLESSVMTWQSPNISQGELQVAKLRVEVNDGIGTAFKEISLNVTAAPLVVVEQPTQSIFEPGTIEFFGRARDYLNSAIPLDRYSWFVATEAAELVMLGAGTATFSYRFTAQGSYTVALSAVDSNGITGTGTRVISIINSRPVCVISFPANNSTYPKDTPVALAGVVNDYEDGPIVDATKLTWYSDLDGMIGSGPNALVASLSSGMHTISLVAVDSGGAVGSASIVIWYDLPARITFTPPDLGVIFSGYPITFVASGTDSDNTPLDASQFTWHLNGAPAVWQTGETFTIPAGSLAAGTYRVSVQGPSKYETVVTPDQAIEIGWPVASITSPASGTRFEPATPINFVAVPGATGTLNLAWYLDNETTAFASGSNVVYTPVNGSYQVTYAGTDIAGNTSSSTINIVVERIPILAFRPEDASYIFGGNPITFDAYMREDTNGNAIQDSKLSWLRDGLSWRTGSSLFTVSQGGLVGQLATGTYDFTLVAEGPYGTVGSRTHTITTGVARARILSPGNNSTFLSGTNITFNGTPDSIGTIDMYWYANYGLPGQILIGDGMTVSTNTLPDGYHQITYIGTDSIGFASRADINISIGQFPIMDFTPGAGTAFFTGQNITFTGVGTDTLNGTAIPGNRMAWYIDGGLELASYSTFVLNAARVNVIGGGNKLVELRGTNSIGAVGTEIKAIDLGVQLATITSPLADTVIPPSTLQNFTGLPDNTGPITMEWWLDYNLPGATLLGNGASLNAVIPDGIHYITYVGTDSANLVSSATIRVIVSNSPAISFTPGDNSRLFVGQPFYLTIGGAIEPATVKWYRPGDVVPWKTGSPALVNPGDLTVGLHLIKAEGENLLGVSNDISNNIYYGVDLASITSPASGTRFARGSTVTFNGTPAPVAPISMEWYRSDGVVSALIGSGNSISTAIPDGWQTITYMGTDSAGFCSSSSIQILMNDPPAITFTPPADGVSTAVIFNGGDFTLTGTGIEAIPPGPAINPATFRWYRGGSLWKTGSPANVSAGELTVGLHSIEAVGTDQYGTQGTGTHSIFYGHPLASIISPASGTTFARTSTVNFTGSNASPSITMEWELNSVNTGVTGVNYSAALPDGLNTIRYFGTDDAGNVTASHVMVLMNNPPTMDFTPGNGSRFFAGSNISFSGTGLSSIAGLPVLTSTMRWFVDGNAVADRTNSPATFNAGSLSVGNHTLRLAGRDEYGTEGDVTHSFYYGHPLADITSPASGASYNIGDTVNFTGTPDTTAPITMYWYLDHGLPGETLLGNGQSLSQTFATRGIKTISYLGTDSMGLMSKKTIQIRINNNPTMSISSPVAGGRFFGGQLLSVSGSGLNTEGDPLSSTGFSWYLNGSLWKTGVANFSASVAELATGTQNIRLDGVDELGTSGTVTNTIVTGFDLPAITSPASGTNFTIGSTVNLTGFPDTTAPITFYWYENYGLPGETQFGSGAAGSRTFATRGVKTLTYLATDSANTLRTKTIQILVNNPPTMTITQPADGGRYFGGQGLPFSGSGLNSGGLPVNSTTFKWYRDSTNFKSGLANFTATVGELPTGTYQIGLHGTDDFGSVNGATITVDLGFDLPNIVSPASGTSYPINTSVLFTGSPDTTAPITFYWYLDYGLASQAVFATGANSNYLFNHRGRRTIGYVATDSANTLRAKTIQILINDDPTVSIALPVNGGKYFGGQSINFSGSGTDSGGGALSASTFKWYRGTTNFKTGFANFAATIAELPTGTHQIGLQAADEFGYVDGATITVDLGFDLPNITSPASGTRYSIGSSVNFAGSPDSSAPITFYWYNDYSLPSKALLGIGQSASWATATRGIKTISYLATDSANTLRSKQIQILVNDPPVFTLHTPIDNGRYFGGTGISFTASGTDSGLGTIASGSFRWYRNGILWKTATDAFTSLVTDLPTGTYQISVGGADEFGTAAYATHTINTGFALPNITSPASGTRVAVNTPVTFTGTPDSLSPITLYWFDNSMALLGNGSTINYVPGFARGIHNISYLGTDSANVLRSRTIQILANNPPTPTITLPVNNGRYFGGQSINFSGSGTNMEGTPIPASSYRWYRNGTQWNTYNGVDIFSATVADFATGTHNISLQVFDEFGTSQSATYSIRVGVALPNIISPASGTRFDTGSNITFTGNDISADITMEWRWIEGNISLGTGPVVNTSALTTRGWQTIRYVGTDSQNVGRESTIMVLIDKLPAFTVLPYISTPTKFSDGPLYAASGNYIPIHIASAGTAVTFSVQARNEDLVLIPPASITWFNGATNLGSVATLTRNFENPGSYTYTVRVEDEYQQTNTASFTFWIWDTETYHSGALLNPTAIVNSGDTMVFVADPGNSRILKLTRKTTGLTEAGDIYDIASQTSTASYTHEFIDLAISGSVIYSLGSAAPVDYRIQLWETNNMHLQAVNFTKAHGSASDQFVNPRGISIDTNAIYIADYGNDRVKKLDRNTGAFYSQSQAVSGPVGIKYVNSTSLFVAENTADRVLRFESDLNNVATWNSSTANNASYFAVSATGNIYVTDPTPGNPKVHVIAPSGALLYSFGKNGTTANTGEFNRPYGVVIVGTDIYVVDNAAPAGVVRFRSGGW